MLSVCSIDLSGRHQALMVEYCPWERTGFGSYRTWSGDETRFCGHIQSLQHFSISILLRINFVVFSTSWGRTSRGTERDSMRCSVPDNGLRGVLLTFRA